MVTTEIFIVGYFVIGLIISWLYTTLRYGKTLDNQKNIQHSIVSMYMLYITLLWPVYFIKYIFLLIRYARIKQKCKRNG